METPPTAFVFPENPRDVLCAESDPNASSFKIEDNEDPTGSQGETL